MSTIKVTNLQNASAASPAIVLDANSRATLNGLSYPTEGSLSGRNRIINGSMTVDQRNAGASVTPADGAYTLDRWQYGATQASKVSIQQSTTAPAGFSNSLLVTSLSAYTVGSGDLFRLTQNVEGFNFADMAFGSASAKTVTLSFWVRSSLTGSFGGSLQNSAYDRSYPFTYSISAANTWEYKTITIAGDTTGTWVGSTNGTGVRVNFSLGAGSSNSGTAGVWGSGGFVSPSGQTSVVGTNGATFYITGVQLEAGSVATPFERRSYGQELALCQRYFCSFGGSGNYENYGTGWTTSTTNANTWIQLPTSMRGTPSVSYIGNLEIQTFNNAGYAISSLATSSTESNSLRVYMSAAVSGATANVGCIIRSAGDINARLRLSAEL